MSNKRVGQILREAREAKRLTVRDVSKDTNIAIKFILALENEDYSQFPAETFAMGFLKTYSDYLKLDTGLILNLYRGEQMEESRAPLEELTKPTRPVVSQVKPEKTKIFTILAIVVMVIVVVILFGAFFDDMDNNDTLNVDRVENTTEKPTAPTQEIDFDKLTFLQKSILPGRVTQVILNTEKGVKFSVSDRFCKLYLHQVKEADSAGIRSASFGFNIFPEKNIYKFTAKVREKVVLDNRIQALAPLRRKVTLEMQVISSKAAKVMVRVDTKEVQGPPTVSSGNVPIQVSLKFLKRSYAEFVIDGQRSQGTIRKGQLKILEANNRLELKVVDGSAVELSMGGKSRGKLGRPGQLVKKVFYKVPDPFDSTRYNIREAGE
ncbi:MAG: helix-turn-helix domain-containing protein [Spirochaetota bacterium]